MKDITILIKKGKNRSENEYFKITKKAIEGYSDIDKDNIYFFIGKNDYFWKNINVPFISTFDL